MGSQSIQRTPSVTLIEQTRLHVTQGPDGKQAGAQGLADYFANASEGDVLSKGRRLFDLACQLPSALSSPNNGETAAPTPPPEPDSYLPAARGVVELLSQAVAERSPKFNTALKHVVPLTREAAEEAIALATVEPEAALLQRAQVDLNQVHSQLLAAIKQCFVGEDLAFKNAQHLSSESLELFASPQFAASMRQNEQLEDIICQALDAALDAADANTEVPLASMNATDAATFAATQPLLQKLRPELLIPLATARENESAAETAKRQLAERVLVLNIAAAVSREDVDIQALVDLVGLAAFDELAAKHAELFPNMENGVLLAQIDRVMLPYVDILQKLAAEEPDAMSPFFAQLFREIMPEAPADREAFLVQLMQTLNTAGAGSPDTVE